MYKEKKSTIPRILVKQSVQVFHNATSVFDFLFFSGTPELMFPPIFIVGAPRSGTTLFYQVLTHSFETAYLPNIANWFYRCPLTATKIGFLFCPTYRSSFSSRFGYEKGCMAPSEAGNIWNRWFPHEGREKFNYTPKGYLNENDRKEIFSLITHLERLFHAPFLSKNVKMSVRIPAVSEIFPEAIFLYIQRNPLHAAASILRIRRQNQLKWWSVMPEEIDRIQSLPEIEQVCHQVFWVEKDIERDLRRFFPEQYMRISYEDLCRNPNETLSGISEFLEKKGVSVRVKSRLDDVTFRVVEASENQWVSRSDLDLMERILQDLYSKHRDAK